MRKDEYARGLVRFGEAMRGRDPRIRIAACGYAPFGEIGRDWNRALYEFAGDQIDIMTFHTYIPALPRWTTSAPVQRMRTVLSHPHYYEQSIRDMARRMTAAGMAKPQIAVTEYNLNPRQVESPRLDRSVHLLWYAQMAHVWMRTGDIVPLCHITEMTPFDVPFRRFGATSPRFEVFKLYAHQAGDRPVLARVTCPTYDVKNVAGQFVPLSDVPIIDAVALVGEADGERFLSLLAVNKELKDTVKLHVELHEFVPSPEGVLYTIRDPDPAGEPETMPGFQTQKTTLEVGESFAYDLPPCSVTLFRLRSQAVSSQ
jgi:alpha-L-arabinofuranosidase